MVLDAATRRNLELTATIREQKKSGSLLGVLDRTITAMGGRLINKWLNQPLIKKTTITRRLQAIEELTNNYSQLQQLREHLEGIYDLERILGKITYESANARDLAFLRQSLQKLPDLENCCQSLQADYWQQLMADFDPLADLEKLLARAIVAEPPVTVREGGLIKANYHQELDELRKARGQGKDWIANLQKKERERTGINSLKVGFNKVFGYYMK